MLYKHAAVHMCAVIGLPDEKWGEVGKACVVLKPGQSATEEELMKLMQENLRALQSAKERLFHGCTAALVHGQDIKA